MERRIFGLVWLAIGLAVLVCLFAGCGGEKHKGPLYVNYKLTVSVGTGVEGWPQTGIYSLPAGIMSNYGYHALDNFSNLVVRLDTTQVAATDSFLIDMDHTLTATCDVRVLWRRHVETPGYYCSPAIGADGTIYFASGMFLLGTGYLPGTLYALNSDGTSKWEYYLGKTFFSPAIGENGWIYVMDQDYKVYAFRPGGSVAWTYSDFEYPFAKRDMGQRTPAIGADGTIYVGADGLYALDPDTGERRWHFSRWPPGHECMASPVIGEDNTVYVVIGEDTLYAVNPNGTRKWAFGFDHDDEMSFATPAIDAAGVIYIPTERSSSSQIYAINPDGSRKWKYDVEGARVIRASPVIAEDGTIYIATKAGGADSQARVFALTPGEVKLWEMVIATVHQTPDDVYATPTVGSDGMIYFGSENEWFYAVEPGGTLSWKHHLVPVNWSGPAVADDGTLYLGGIDLGTYYTGVFCAVVTSSQGLAASPWPKFHHDNRNTGRFGAQ
ncbi:MAG TPA: PQQ-binding-like beta-propeller repeat protein [bacterium]|nr:PQQ-binding-like beta-propeller repeat protein [bacterium]